MTEIDRLINKALDKSLAYRAKPLSPKHNPHLTIHITVLNTPRTKKALKNYLLEYEVIDIQTNGWWVSFLFGK